jgi:hypothetical protein
MYNFIVNYYQDKDKSRNADLEFCILHNLSNPLLNVVVIANQNDYQNLLTICNEAQRKKITAVIKDERPTFYDYFNLITQLFAEDKNINIVSNLDIIFTEDTLTKMNEYLTDGVCLALSRWDINNVKNFQVNSQLFNRRDSQDVWVFKGAVPDINGADFPLGIAGCDNSIAHLLSYFYEVKNPSFTIRCYHLHLTPVRNYISAGKVTQTVPPPYKLLPPTD